MSETQRRPVTAEDLFRLKLVSDPQIDPSGTQIVYGLQRTDRAQNKYFSNLWLVRADGTENRPFTQGEQSDRNARWSPDGHWIAFLSDRGETSQLWLISAHGGEARKLTALEEGSLADISWSPDGTRILFRYRPKPEWQRKAVREEREKQKLSTPPLRIRRLSYREEGCGYFGEERWHLYVIAVESGKVTQITTGETDQGSAAWSPDGTRVAFVTNRSPDPDRTPQLDEIRIVPADGSGAEQLIEAPAGPKGALTWSPDGRSFAYYGHTDTRDVWSATEPHLWILPAEGGEARDLMAELDRPAGDATLGDVRSFGGGWQGPTWTPDSRNLFFLVSDRGACHLYHASVEDGRLTNLTPNHPGEIASLSLDRAAQRAAVVAGDPGVPGEVYTLSLTGPEAELQAVTALTEEFLNGIELARVEEFEAPGEAGEVHGWLMRPTAPPPPGGYPLILYIHGGPHTQYGWAFMHEFQCLAGRGFAVLYTNPRGSRGYGNAHAGAIRGDWGGPDYRDVMAAVEGAAALPEIDADRLGVTGGSYGGYMTNWIIGHTDRFRAAVTQRSVVNLHSMGGTCDFSFADSEYFGGNSWSAPERFHAQSPLSHLEGVQTPLLIIHSEGDLRCPIEQAEQLFAALKNLGKEVEFIRFPREANHGLSRSGPPDLRLARLGFIAGWMERHLLDG